MPVQRTCQNCNQKYTITNVAQCSPQNTNRIEVRCPACNKLDGTVMADPAVGQAFTKKGW